MAKLTIEDILARKDQLKNKQLKHATLRVTSLDAEITIQEPTRPNIMQSRSMGDDQADDYLVYQCVVDPDLRGNHQHWQDEFGCAEPHEIVGYLFSIQETSEIAMKALELAGIKPGTNLVDEVKN